jgi:2'-5' RNA ligase
MGNAWIMKLYFIALLAPPFIADQVLQWKNEMHLKYGCQVALKSPAHITLIPPFNASQAEELQLLQFLQEFAPQQPALEVSVNGFGIFGQRTIFLAVEKNKPLELLFQLINRSFRQEFPTMGKTTGRNFHPHITIANRDIPPAKFDEALARFSSTSFKAQCPLNNISLLRLDPGKWTTLKSFTFQTSC